MGFFEVFLVVVFVLLLIFCGSALLAFLVVISPLLIVLAIITLCVMYPILILVLAFAFIFLWALSKV